MTDVPSWEVLLCRAMDAHVHLPSSSFCQLATVTPDGLPAVRTVRFRFVLPGSRLVLSTDLRSEKVRQLASTPVAELCWYFAESQEQFRFHGSAAVVGADATGELAAARARSWRDRSAVSRQGFTWPPPGEPLAGPAAFAAPEPADPPPPFGLIVLSPSRVDYLDLRPHPQVRAVFERVGEGWVERRVNP